MQHQHRYFFFPGLFLFVFLVLVSAPKATWAEEPAFSEASFPKKCVGSPEFDTKDGKNSAGTAALVKVEDGGPVFIATVRHLLGPNGGFAKETPAENVAEFVKAIKLDGLFEGKKKYKVEAFTLPSTDDRENPLQDLAVFKTEGSADDAALLSPTLPALGEAVWVVAHVRGGVPEGQLLHRAVVDYAADGKVTRAIFDSTTIITAGASGAPVFNSSGKVIGIYTAHNNYEGKVYAFIIPSTTILQIIKGK